MEAKHSSRYCSQLCTGRQTDTTGASSRRFLALGAAILPRSAQRGSLSEAAWKEGAEQAVTVGHLEEPQRHAAPRQRVRLLELRAIAAKGKKHESCDSACKDGLGARRE